MFVFCTQRVGFTTAIWLAVFGASRSRLYLAALEGVAAPFGDGLASVSWPYDCPSLLSFSRKAPCLLGVRTAMA
jgi:hypothetical protein